MKSKGDKLYVNKLAPVSVDLKKLSDVIDNNVVKNTVYNEWVKKVNAIQITDTSYLVKKLTKTQNLVKFKGKYLIMILVNILLHRNLIS